MMVGGCFLNKIVYGVCGGRWIRVSRVLNVKLDIDVIL